MICVVASLLAGPRYSKREKKLLSIFALFNFVCDFEAMRLQSVATHHISASAVIYVREDRAVQWSVWKLEIEAWLTFVRAVKQLQIQGNEYMVVVVL